MLDHVTLRASDRGASEAFYETVLPTVGKTEPVRGGTYTEWGDFSVAQADAGHPPTRRLHVAFFAPDREGVHAFWQAGVDAGYRSDGDPGPRPQYREDYYGGFLLDPDGNSVEAVHHDQTRQTGAIDHVWMRVADVAAAKAFYETIAPHAGIRVRTDRPDLVQFVGDGISFSVVAGEQATEHVHIAFPSDENSAVDGFHRAATAAGYRDNGPPGERPEYHAGYYGAFVLDPDGNNVEVVNHNR